MIDLKSWNPWHGCRKYSEGCANCYMFVLDKAHKVPGQSTEIFRTRNFSKPLERDRKGNVTDDEGYFSMPVPENLDTSDLVDVFASNGARVVRYRETSTGIRIVIEPSQKRERAMEQK